MKKEPIYFYLRPPSWPPADALLDPSSADHLYFGNAAFCWILQTYLRLRTRGCNVELTNRLVDSGIIVICSGDVPVTFVPNPRQLIISINADEAPDVFTQLRVTQNKIQERLLAGSYFIPLWPQAGLMARDPARGEMFASVSYFGDDPHLSPELRDEQWADFLASRNIEWIFKNASSTGNADYSKTDCVIAVRSFRRAGFIRKPASKLFNAWIAGVPAILGREFAFREQRKSALDYIEINSYAEACAAIDRLAGSSALRRQMVENGRKRVHEVSIDQLAQRWEHLLYEVAPEAARRWAALSDNGRKAFLLRRQLGKKARGAAHRLLRAAGQEQYAI